MAIAKQLKVLVVDDTSVSRMLLVDGLNQIGITNVAMAGDGEQGLKAMMAGPAHLVLSDFNMPKLDGLQFLRALREYAPTKQVGFILVSLSFGLVAGDGHLAQAPGSTWEFLFRPWIWPPVADWWAYLATGMAVGIGGLMMSQAYRTTEAALVAPFEYIGMPMAIFWGVVVFGTWPDATAWVGIALICGAGLYTLWRETVRRRMAHGGR